jgi:hypothetical protein
LAGTGVPVCVVGPFSSKLWPFWLSKQWLTKVNMMDVRGGPDSIERARAIPGHTLATGRTFLMADLRAEAQARHQLHARQASSRPLSPDYELLGLAGEMQGEADFGIQRDARLLSAGDGRSDFRLRNGLSGDWKVARRAYNLLMEAGRPHADLFVAGLWHEDGRHCWVEWLGWESAARLRAVEPCDFGYGVINHYCPVDELQPMWRFAGMCRDVVVQIRGGHFTGRLVASGGRVERADPILAFMRGWDGRQVATYCQRRGWICTRLGQALADA